MSNVVISVEDLSKSYRLGVIGTGTFYGDVKRWWAKQRGKPDPYLKIGETDHGNRQDEMIWALKDVNFTVRQGEAVGIIGRNGAGKSTLFKILSQITSPTSGVVKVKGKIASLLEVGTGFHPELTGRENIYLNAAIMGMSRVNVQNRFDEIVDFSGVEKFIDTPVKRYSSGMYVRLAFAVAAHLDTEILLIDEVLAVGDAAFQRKCLGKMGDVAKEGRTVLFVSHNLGAITNLCSSAFLLDSGKIVFTDSPEKVVSRYLHFLVGRDINEVVFDKAHSDAYFTKIAVLDAHNQIAYNIQVTKSFKIRFEYEVVHPLLGEVAFSLFDKNGSRIFYSGASKNLAIQDLKHEPGCYVAEVEIPAKFLAPGTYTITAVLHRPNIQLFDRHEHVIGFSVIEIGSSDYLYAGQDLGSLLVQFNWTVNQLDNKATLI